MIIDLLCHQTRIVSVVINAKKKKFGMIIGAIHVKLITMVIFVPKMEKLDPDGIRVMEQFIHITMLAEMHLELVVLVDTIIVLCSMNNSILGASM